jgi:hypothetical protein
MRKSKLIELLQTFDAHEWHRFEDFIASPYYNKNETVSRMFHFLKDQYPAFDFSKENLLAATYPDKRPEEAKLGAVMNLLLKLAEQFLAIESFQKEGEKQNMTALSIYSDRKLQKHYQFLYKKLCEKIDAKPVNTTVLLEKFRLEEIGLLHFVQQRVRRFDPSIQRAYTSLNAFYYVQLLKYTCNFLSSSEVVSGDFSASPVSKAIISMLLASKASHPPLLEIYLSIFQTISTEAPENDNHFEKLMALIGSYQDEIERKEMREIFLFAINFCAKKVRKGVKKYTPLVLKIYEDGIRSGALFENGYLSHWTYTNVVKLGLYQKKFEWTANFIHQYKDDLPPDSYSDAFHFNLAELYFYQGNYNEVLSHLHQLQFSDTFYKLGSRIILIKSFYEMDEMESLLSLLASFSVFLKRNKEISPAHQKTCLNFCKLLHQILKRNQKNWAQLIEEIKTVQPLAERAWLLKVGEETVA